MLPLQPGELSSRGKHKGWAQTPGCSPRSHCQTSQGPPSSESRVRGWRAPWSPAPGSQGCHQVRHSDTQLHRAPGDTAPSMELPRAPGPAGGAPGGGGHRLHPRYPPPTVQLVWGGQGDKEGPSAPDETLGQGPLHRRSPRAGSWCLPGRQHEESSGSPESWVPVPGLSSRLGRPAP